jgi:translocation and assembly module TamB
VRVLRLLWQFLRAAVIAALFVSGAGTWFALFAESGATLALGALEQLSGGAIRASAAAGPLRGPIRLQGFVYEDRAVRLEIEHLHLDWSLRALFKRQLVVNVLETGAVELRLKPSDAAADRRSGGAPGLPLPLRLERGHLAAFTLHTAADAAPLVFERVTLSADWIGEDIVLRRLALRYAPVGNLAADGRLALLADELQLRELRVQGLAVVEAEGVIGFDNRVRLELSWQDLHWPPEGEAQVRSPAGDAVIDGTWTDFAYRLRADAEFAPLGGAVEARGRGSVHGLRFDTLRAQLLGGSVQASGALEWSPQPALALNGAFSGIDPGGFDARWPGRLNGRFDADLDTLTPLQGRAQFTLQDSTLRDRRLDLAAEAEARGDALRLRELDLRSGASRLRLSGSLRPQLDAAGTLDSTDLSELWPGLGGSARAQLQLRGSRVQPQIVLDARLREVSYGDLGVHDARLAVNLDARGPSQFRLELLDAVAGVHVERAMLSGAGTVADNRFDLYARSAVGDLTMSFAGALDLQALQWRGRLRSGQGEPLRLSPWVLEEGAGLELGLGGMVLAPACWRSADSRACAQFTLSESTRRTAFRVENLAFAYFEPLLPAGWSVDGDFSGRGRAWEEHGQWRAEADLQTSAGTVTIACDEVLRFAPSRWLAEETGQGFVSQLELPVIEDGGGAAASAGLYWDALLSPAPQWSQRRWSGTLRADLSSLQPLRLLSPELESIEGSVHGGFDISGSAGAPRLDGAVALRDGRLRLATPGIELREIGARVEARADSSQVRFSARARSGDGALAVEGSADLARLGDSLQLVLSGEDFQAAATPQMRIWVTPRLEFRLEGRRADLSGEVVVPRAEINLTRLDLGVAPSSDQVIIEPGGEAANRGLLRIYSRLRIGLGDAVRFRGFGLDTRLAGALQVSDEPGRPTTARGEVRLEEGQYKAYGQDLRIETGRLIFNGGPVAEPAVDIRAQREPTEEVTVGLHVRGRLAAPEFSLYSTPAMPQEQQLAWLILGRPLQDSSGSGAERSALGGAALSLGLSGSNFIANTLRGGLRLDEISIGSRPGESPELAQLTFGKYLSPKLFVSYGVGLFQPGQAFRLLYDIGRGFKLRTESGVQSGGDLVYTIETD